MFQRGRSEGDSPKTRVLKMRPDLGCEAVYWQGYIAGYRVFDRADKTIAAERSAWEAWRTAELVALAEGEKSDHGLVCDSGRGYANDA